MESGGRGGGGAHAAVAFEGHLLEVGVGVGLIDDLFAEHGLDDVLHGHYSAQTAVSVAHDGDMFLLFEKALPDVEKIVVFAESQDGAAYLRQTPVEIVFDKRFENCRFEDIARDVVFVVVIDRNSREAQFAMVEKFFDGHGLGNTHNHKIRCHDLLGADVGEFDSVLDYAALLVFEHSFLGGYGNHCRHFLAADRDGFLVGGKYSRDIFREPDERIGDEDECVDHGGGRQGEASPVGRADGLGDNF